MEARYPKSGYIGLFNVKNVPILIHWSFPIGGVFIAYFLGDVTWITTISLIVAYTLLITLHELGHAIAARMALSKVHAVLVTGIGGLCFADEPDSYWNLFLFYAGGIIAQIIVLSITAFYIYLNGNPESIILQCFVTVFTVVNAFLIIVNIIPGQGTDGDKLWKLMRGRK